MYETYFNLNDRPFASVPRANHLLPPAGVIDALRNLRSPAASTAARAWA